MVGLNCRHAQDGEIDEARYAAYMSICRAAVPYWARSHQDFEGAAHVALAEVLSAYDPARGVTIEFVHCPTRELTHPDIARTRGSESTCTGHSRGPGGRAGYRDGKLQPRHGGGLGINVRVLDVGRRVRGTPAAPTAGGRTSHRIRSDRYRRGGHPRRDAQRSVQLASRHATSRAGLLHACASQ